MGVEPGETRNILITTAQYIYRVSVDGYMSGYADEKIRISQKNRERIYEMWRYCGEINRDGETFDSWFAAVQSGQRDNGGSIYAAGDGKPAETDDLIYDESQRSDRAGYPGRIGEDSGEIDYESLEPGAMYFDGEKSYTVVETEYGLEHIELVDAEEMPTTEHFRSGLAIGRMILKAQAKLSMWTAHRELCITVPVRKTASFMCLTQQRLPRRVA